MKRKRNPLRFRKRPPTTPTDHDPRSTVLRALRDLVQTRQFAAALTRIDSEVAATADTDYRARLLSHAADCLSKQGRFADAATAYASVRQVAQAQPLSWLRPSLAEVHCLIRNVQVADAQARALALVQTATAKQQAYQTQLAQAQITIAAGGQAVIPVQPPTPSQAANRLAELFFSEGEIAPAKALYQQSLQLSPNSTHARLGLAEIALRENNPVEAARLARETLVLGQCHKRTTGAWPILLASARMTGGPPFETTLLSGLAQATPGVRARATLVIAKGLRGQSDARWLSVTNNWLQAEGPGNATIAAELRKLKAAHARLTNAALTDQLQKAQAVLATANLSPVEWLGAAKHVVKTTLLLNETPAIDALLTQAANKFGVGKRPRFVHGLALACVRANRSNLAMLLLQQNVATATGEALGKSLWALAKIQTEQGNHATAAQSYWSYSQNATFPNRMRLYALLQWTREIAAANQPELVIQARPQIEAALPQINNYELVLDLSRQIRLSKLPQDFVMQVFQRGQQLALQAFDACGHPSPAATILFKLCRRANDHRQYDAMIATWTRLPEAKRQWLWSENKDYWQWVEHVFRAYRDSNRQAEAEQFVTPMLNDSATPQHGYAILGVTYAAMKRKQGDFTTMFAVYEKMAQVAPTYEWTSVAYYWFALRAWKQGNPLLAATNADKMLLALGKDRQMTWKTKMAASALCLKSGLNLTMISTHSGFTVEELQTQLTAIHADLARLNT